MDRPRACAAVIHDDMILMVNHQNGPHNYWTLPGGGVNDGETFEQAVVREVKEESGLDVTVGDLLFTEEYEFGKSHCYLARLIGDATEPTLAFLPGEESIFGTMVRSVAWHSLKDKKHDVQVSKVISTLGLKLP
jgi:8-oxo-dGTP diphosphatase